MNRIQQLHAAGQSIWLDYIERSMLQKGELKQLVDEGLTGVTSNPTIFQNAISSSDAYNDDLQALATSDKDDKTVFEALAIADIQDAADVLRPVYDANNRQDGFVSIEVAPDLAYDLNATLEEARRLFNSVNRPNVMIKVPATEPGVDAIHQLISEGININVTLIFALDRYAAVKEAYLSGLEARLARGDEIAHIASVASFFVSRVDSNVDSKLEQIRTEKPEQAEQAKSLMGKIAIANAKLAYQQFEERFSGERWEKLANAGAQLQRPLWASTSVKTPDYPELLYVESLIGPHTVDTMPPDTLKSFRKHGEIKRTVDQEIERASQHMTQLAALGISIDEVTDQLEKEGVKKFADSYDDLLAAIAQQRKEMAVA